MPRMVVEWVLSIPVVTWCVCLACNWYKLLGNGYVSNIVVQSSIYSSLVRM